MTDNTFKMLYSNKSLTCTLHNTNASYTPYKHMIISLVHFNHFHLKRKDETSICAYGSALSNIIQTNFVESVSNLI